MGLAVFSLCSLSCHMSEHIYGAKNATNKFHQRLDAEDYKAIYAYSDDVFQKETTMKDLTAILAAVHRKPGKVQQAKPENWFVTFAQAPLLSPSVG